MEEKKGRWPWNIGEGWVGKRAFSASCRAKIEQAAFIAAEIANGTWDFGEESIPMHRDKSRRIPLSYVMEHAGWSKKSGECRKYLTSSYFVKRFDHEMEMRQVGYVGQLAKLGDELGLDSGSSVLKNIGMAALQQLHERVTDPHQIKRFTNRDLLSLAQFGLQADAKLKAAQKSRDEAPPTFSIQTDVMNVLSVDDPRRMALLKSTAEEADRQEAAE